jgi:Uma2 family endonuclease
MTLSVGAKLPKKRFAVGTLGWTADDLDDPRIEKMWERGRYEIVEGVLTEMPAARFDTSQPLLRLLFRLQGFVDRRGLGGSCATETDVIVAKQRVAIVDGIYLTAEDERRQAALYARKPNRHPRVRFGRLMIAPTLIIENISLGHEAHDRETKFSWYAQAGVKNYWMLDPYRRSLECFVLAKSSYRLDTSGSENDLVRPALFKGLTLRLAELWRPIEMDDEPT